MSPNLYTLALAEYRLDKADASVHLEYRRLSTYVRNIEKIRQHNERYNRGEESFEMGINQFSDMVLLWICICAILMNLELQSSMQTIPAVYLSVTTLKKITFITFFSIYLDMSSCHRRAEQFAGNVMIRMGNPLEARNKFGGLERPRRPFSSNSLNHT